MACAPSEDSDQPGHPPSLISPRCPHEESVGPWLPIERKRRLLSDRADAQADMSLRWAHSHFVGFVMKRLIEMIGDKTVLLRKARGIDK